MKATIIMTIREKYSTTRQSVESLYKNTPDGAFEFIFVNYLSPAETLPDFPKSARIIESQTSVPQLNRILAASLVDTKYTIFTDNDVIFEEGWYENLIECAESDPSIGVVGPLYLWNNGKIHMAGGKITRTGKSFDEQHMLVNFPRESSPAEKVECDFVEYHCIMMRSELLPLLDPAYSIIHEHIDICLAAKKLGYKTYFQPKSVVHYLNDFVLQDNEVGLFKARWDSRLADEDIKHFCEKWGIENNANFNGVKGFVRHHRLKYGVHLGINEIRRPPKNRPPSEQPLF